MSNVLSEEKRQQVVALGRLGWPLRRIEEATGVRRETAGGYLRAAGLAVRPPGRWGHGSVAPEANPAKGCPPTPDAPESNPAKARPPTSDAAEVPYPGRSPTTSACEAHRDFVELSAHQGRNAVAIWQDLVDRHGFGHGYASVKRFVARLRGAITPEASGIIITGPGEEAQVDYGDGPMVRHPETGKYRRARLFVMTLGCSRKAVRLLTFRSSVEIWSQLHETAFRRLGGAVKVVVLDNLKEGVLRPDIYDPAINPLYRDVLTHYGAVALPCRVRDPDRKGKVEAGIGHAQRTPLKGLRFESLEEAQAHLDHWETRWADTRIHGTTKRQVAAMFAEEKPHLTPLPVEPFRYYRFGDRTVHLDNHVEVEGAYYQAPPGTIHDKVHVQWNGVHVRLISKETGQLLREYLRQRPGGYRGREEERHPDPIPASTRQLLVRAKRAGKRIGAVALAMHTRDGEVCVRRIFGLLALAKTRGIAAVDDACGIALEMGAPTYRAVKRYLDHRPPVQLTLSQVDPLIRELTEYRDLVDRMTNKETTE